MTQFWMLWPDNPALSIFVLAIVAMVFLYAARKPMHDLIRAVGALLGGPLRLAARWLIDTAAEMKARNKAMKELRLASPFKVEKNPEYDEED